MVIASRLLAAGLLLSLGLVPGNAEAQDVPAAEALFREGRRLFDAGHYAAACSKLAESQRQDPSSGTLLNLAACHEKQGRLATAWAEFLAAARLAISQHMPLRAEEAKRRASAIEGALSYLTIKVINPVPGLRVARDGIELEEGALGSRLPVDPAHHVIKVEAPGYQPEMVELIIGARSEDRTILLPTLKRLPEPEPAPELSAPPPPSPPSVAPPARPAPSLRSNVEPSTPVPTNRTALWVAGGAGLALTAIGSVFGALALSDYSRAKNACPTRTDCSDNALSARERAGSRATVANVTGGLGLAGLGTAFVLYLVEPATPGSPTRSRLVPTLGPAAASLSYSRAF